MKHKKFIKKHKGDLALGKRSIKQKFILMLLVCATMANALVAILMISTSLFLPSVSEFQSLSGAESTVFFDSQGEVLYNVNQDEERENVKSEDIPELVKLAAIAIEDDRFYKHNGFDLGGIFKAFLSELGFGPRRGGSTVTQQFIKNAVLSNERTYTRKLKELILAVKLERYATKDQIITMYLNRIPYGGTAYGVKKASDIFFDKDTTELSLGEAAILASLPKAPTYFSPFGANQRTLLTREFTAEELEDRDIEDITDLKKSEYSYGLLGSEVTLANGNTIYLPGRADEVLKRMDDLGYIKKTERDLAVNELKSYEFNSYQVKTKAYHFVMYVKQLLEEKYGQDLVESGGLKVYTTLDYEVQKQVEEIVKTQAEYNANFDANNAAVVSINPKNGHVAAMVGSADFSNKEIEGYNNMVLAKRQPGSTFKPISFAAAMINGLSPGNFIFDVPIKIGEDEPKNFDGEFMGPITVRKALGQSRNIPAVKSYYIGGEQDSIVDLSENLGITSYDKSADYGWPLSLGTGELSMLELAQAYSTFANGGKFMPVNPILKVVTFDGDVLEDNTQEDPSVNLLEDAQEVLDPRVAFMINDVLSDTSVNLGRLLSMADNRPVAAKTGTSTKRIGEIVYPTNLWTVGWTPDYVTVAWAGNSDGSRTKLEASGYGSATPIWHNTMNLLHENVETSEFEKPKDLERMLISSLSGDLPSNSTPLDLVNEDWFLPEFVPTDPDMSFYKAVVDTRNLKMPNEYCPQSYVKSVTFFDNTQAEKYTPRLVSDRQAEIAEWFLTLDQEAREKLNLGENLAIGRPIEETSEICSRQLASNHLSLEILNLADGFYVDRGTSTIDVNVDSQANIEKVEYFLNDDLHYTALISPYNGVLRVSNLIPKGKKLNLRIRVEDVNGYVREIPLSLTVGDSKRNPTEFDRPFSENFESMKISPVMDAFNNFLDGFSNNTSSEVQDDPCADDAWAGCSGAGMDAGSSNKLDSGARQTNPQKPTSKVLEFNPNNFTIQ